MEQTNQPLLALSVRSGRHAGAQQAISMTAFSIGSSFESDLVLSDPSVWPSHARLSVRDQMIKVEAVASPLFVNGTELALNAAAETRLPSRLRVGDIEIDIGSVGFTSNIGSQMPKILIGLAALLILGGSSVFLLQGGSLFGAKPASLSRSQPSGERASSLSLAEIHSAANILRERLAAAKISTVQIVESAGMIRAKGTVTSASKDSWDALQVWFDDTYGRGVLLQSEVAVLNPEAPTPPIAIQSVWTGKQPYLIDGQGKKHFEGVLLKDGWIIERIEPEKVTLTRNNQRMVLTF